MASLLLGLSGTREVAAGSGVESEGALGLGAVETVAEGVEGVEFDEEEMSPQPLSSTASAANRPSANLIECDPVRGEDGIFESSEKDDKSCQSERFPQQFSKKWP